MRFAAIVQRFRFSILSMMGIVLAVGLVFGWYLNSARLQKEAVEAIQEAGGLILYEQVFQNRKIVSNPSPGNPWLRRVLGPDYFDKVVYVNISGLTSTDLLMPHVARLKSLKQLELTGSDVTDRGLAEIRGLGQLDRLEIARTKLTPASFATLGDLIMLRSVNFDGIPCDDAALKQLGRIIDLVTLKLKGCPITDDGLAHVAGLKKLESIDLSDTAITDAGLKFLLPGKHLQNVGLSGTKVTAAGIARLAEIPRLRRGLNVTVKRTLITVDEIKALRRQYPDLDLQR